MRMDGASMSMLAFQRAYADLAASPKLCLAVRADPLAALATYDLTDRERDRLARAVWQRGMDANCTLYRATRLTALNAVIPLTLGVIRPTLRELLDTYWEDNPVHDVRFASETARFIAWLELHPTVLPEPAEDIIALARRELAIEEERLASDAIGPQHDRSADHQMHQFQSMTDAFPQR
jgi:hypothetical protein